MEVAWQQLYRFQGSTYNTHQNFLQSFSSEFSCYWKMNGVVHLQSLHVRVEQRVHWRAQTPRAAPALSPMRRAPRAAVRPPSAIRSPSPLPASGCCCMTVTSSDCCALALTVLKFHPLAPEHNFFIHVTRISHRCVEWVRLLPARSQFGCGGSSEESWAKDAEMNECDHFIWEMISLCPPFTVSSPLVQFALGDPEPKKWWKAGASPLGFLWPCSLWVQNRWLLCEQHQACAIGPGQSMW